MALNDWSAADVAAKLSKSGRGKAKKTSRGWMVCCPAHEDRTPSLSIGDGRKGNLIYHCFGGCRPEDVRDAILNEIGEHDAPVSSPKKKRVIKKEEEVEAIVPVPHDKMGVTPEDFYHFEHGSPSLIWTYRLPRGEIAGWVARYDLPEGGKEVIPWAWAYDPKKNKEELKMKGLPSPRPLYNYDQIVSRPEDPIIWNEGEKAADAAQKLFPNWIPTTFQGGGNAINLTDLKPLHGRVVILLADHDTPGYGTAGQLANMLLGKCKLYFLRWPTAWPDGTAYEIQEKDDAADHYARGWRAEALRTIREERGGLTLPVGEIAPSFDVIHYDRQSERRFQTV